MPLKNLISSKYRTIEILVLKKKVRRKYMLLRKRMSIKMKEVEFLRTFQTRILKMKTFE